MEHTIRRAFASVCAPAAVLLLAAWLGGCSGSGLSDFSFGKDRTPPPADPTQFPADYRGEIAAFMRTSLANPTKVKDAYVGTPVVKPIAGKQQYMTCVRYNPRDSANKYEGNTQNLVIFLSGKVTQFLPDDPQLCAGLAYQRFPEIESMVP